MLGTNLIVYTNTLTLDTMSLSDQLGNSGNLLEIQIPRQACTSLANKPLRKAASGLCQLLSACSHLNIKTF